MKTKFSILLLILTLSGFMATAARAGGGPPPGPPPHPHHHHGGYGGPVFFPSISFVVADSTPSSPAVSLVGHVYRQIGDDTYLFTDGTTTFQLDSDDSNLPIGPRIVIGGRFSGDAEINVHHWHYVE